VAQRESVILPDLRALVQQASAEELPALAALFRELELVAEIRLRLVGTREVVDIAPSGDSESLLTSKEAAVLLRVSPSYVETLVRQGKLPHVRLPAADKGGRSRAGRLVRLRASDLRAWAEKHRA
jgi:hypothetical protein